LNNKYGLASWVSLEKDAIVLEPNETQKIKIKIENKESLSPGGHYAAIMAKMDDEKSVSSMSESNIAFDPSFASLIFVRKVGGEIYNLGLKESEIKNSLIGLPSNIRLRFQNSGNVQVVPRGVVKITDPLGREVLRGIINSDSSLILPETFRSYTVALNDVSFAFVPGKYKVSIEYRYDGKDDFTIESKDIDFIPQVAILAGLIILSLLVLYVWYKFGSRKGNRREGGENSHKQAI
jgi:hypothetical protein